MLSNIETTYNFDEEDNYSFDETKIQVLNSSAELLPTVAGAESEIYLKLDNNKGLVAVDSSGNGNHGAFQGGYNENQWTPGKINSAIKGLGANSGFINLDQLVSYDRTDPFSYEFWIKFSDASGTQVLISKQKSSSNFDGISLNITLGKIRFVIRDVNGNLINVETASLYNDDVFHHVVVTYDGNSSVAGMNLYVDNVLDRVVTSSDTLDSTITNTFYFQISGHEGNNSTILPTTTIDEVVIYSRELTPAEIAFRWNNGSGTQLLPGPGTSFPTDNPTITPFASRSATELLDFDSTITATGSDSVKFALSVDGVDKYWDGAAWVDSSGFSQSNTSAEVKANISSLILTGVSLVILRVYLHSDDGSSTPSIDSMSLSTNLVFNVSGPNVTIVFGVAYKPNGEFSQETFTIQSSRDGREYNTLNQIRDDEQYITPGVDGSWSAQLIDNEESKAGTYYIFKFGDRIVKKVVPKTTVIEYNKLEDY